MSFGLLALILYPSSLARGKLLGSLALIICSSSFGYVYITPDFLALILCPISFALTVFWAFTLVLLSKHLCSCAVTELFCIYFTFEYYCMCAFIGLFVLPGSLALTRYPNTFALSSSGLSALGFYSSTLAFRYFPGTQPWFLSEHFAQGFSMFIFPRS